MRRFLPYPLLSLALLALWMLLQESAGSATLVLGAILALLGGWTFASLRPPKAQLRFRRLLRSLPQLLWDVLVEIVRSNNAVARIILREGRGRTRESGFVVVPLDMRDPYGLAALACILTATPGTVWVDYDSVESTMLLHVLDLIDEEEWVRIVKDKWERRLMEIFE